MALFLAFVLVLPQYDAIKAAKAAQVARQALLTERTAEIDNTKALGRQIELRQGDLDKIRTFLPTTKQIDEIVSSIQKISQDAGLQLTGMTTAGIPEAGEIDYKKVQISLDLVGKYPVFVNFLKLLEQNLRLYDIFEITAAESTTSPGNVNFIIKMYAYYLK